MEIIEEIKETLHEKSAPWLSYGFFLIFIGIMLSVFQQFVGINVVLYFCVCLNYPLVTGNESQSPSGHVVALTH